MAATRVRLPDGSEQASSSVICEGCEKPMSEHSCGGSFTVSTGAGSGSFKTGPRRKDPTAGPLCPHCGGRLHANMAGLAQDVECLARQYYVDDGTMADPFQRLPVMNTTVDLRKILDWADSLATAPTYGRMEAPSGGSGTYASLKPKADPSTKRTKKVRPAPKGERIEDLAASPAPPARAPAAPTGTLVNSKPSKGKTARPTPEPTPAREPEAPSNGQHESSAEDREARRARRQAILAGRG